MITVEQRERDENACSCWECAHLGIAELMTSPLYKVSLPAKGFVLLCERHLRDLGLSVAAWFPPPPAAPSSPVPMRLTCPACNTLHLDEGEFATKPHHTHACQGCGAVWRPAIVPTVGVRFLPGFKNPTEAG